MTRYGMARLIEQESDLVVCGEAENARSALDAVNALRPNVVLVDLTMPGGEGIEFIKDLRAMYPEVAVLVVSMHDEEVYAQRALRAGSRGYIMKSEGGEQSIQAIHQALQDLSISARGWPARSSRFSPASASAAKPAPWTSSATVSSKSSACWVRDSPRASQPAPSPGHQTVDTHRLHLRQKLGFETGAA